MVFYFQIEEHAALKEQERKIKSNRDERERRQGAIQMRLTDFNARNHSSLEPRNHANRPTGRPSERSQITGQKQKKKAGTVAKPGNKRKSLDPSSITGITAIPEPSKYLFRPSLVWWGNASRRYNGGNVPVSA